MTTTKEEKVAGVIRAPLGEDGALVSFDALFRLTQAECDNHKFWFGVAQVALTVPEDTPPIPPCNPMTGGFGVELEDGRHGTAVLQTMHGQTDYWEIGFVGLSPLQPAFPTPSSN